MRMTWLNRLTGWERIFLIAAIVYTAVATLLVIPPQAPSFSLHVDDLAEKTYRADFLRIKGRPYEEWLHEVMTRPETPEEQAAKARCYREKNSEPLRGPLDIAFDHCNLPRVTRPLLSLPTRWGRWKWEFMSRTSYFNAHAGELVELFLLWLVGPLFAAYGVCFFVVPRIVSWVRAGFRQ